MYNYYPNITDKETEAQGNEDRSQLWEGGLAIKINNIIQLKKPMLYIYRTLISSYIHAICFNQKNK